jgi:hypothetical protein
MLLTIAGLAAQLTNTKESLLAAKMLIFVLASQTTEPRYLH